MKSRKQDTRIETERAGRHGGYTQISFGTIDDVTDARGELRAQRSDKGRERQARAKPPMPEPITRENGKSA